MDTHNNSANDLHPTIPGNDEVAAATPRAKRRKPPVIKRVTVGAQAAAPPTDASQMAVPGVPAGFVPVNPRDYRGFHPMASQLAALPEALAELRAFADYSARFGTTAPRAAELTRRLAAAAQWAAIFAQTAAWYEYVQSQHLTTWRDAVELMNELKSPFQLASRADPALAAQYPAIARLLAATRVNAKRSAASRARNKAAQQAPPGHALAEA
jgi:hypothetical protein